MELRSFLGLCNVYRRFVDNTTDIAACLDNSRRNYSAETFAFDDAKIWVFRRVIGVILSLTVLALSQLELPYSIDRNTSAQGLGCSLHQTIADEDRRTIGY